MGERVSVDADALDKLIEDFNSARLARDSEFCVGLSEHEASQQEFDELVRKLGRQALGVTERRRAFRAGVRADAAEVGKGAARKGAADG